MRLPLPLPSADPLIFMMVFLPFYFFFFQHIKIQAFVNKIASASARSRALTLDPIGDGLPTFVPQTAEVSFAHSKYATAGIVDCIASLRCSTARLWQCIVQQLSVCLSVLLCVCYNDTRIAQPGELCATKQSPSSKIRESKLWNIKQQFGRGLNLAATSALGHVTVTLSSAFNLY